MRTSKLYEEEFDEFLEETGNELKKDELAGGKQYGI